MPSPKKALGREGPRPLVRIQVPRLPTRPTAEPTIVETIPEEPAHPLVAAQEGLVRLAGQLDDLAGQLSSLAAALERLAASLQRLDSILRDTLDLAQSEAERTRRLLGS